MRCLRRQRRRRGVRRRRQPKRQAPRAPADQAAPCRRGCRRRSRPLRFPKQRAHGDAVRLGRGDGNLIDHAARPTDALQGVGAVDHLDPVDEEGVDGVAVAGPVADRGRLRDAVDGVKRRTAAQAFPAPLSFSRVGEKEGSRAETASTVEPEMTSWRPGPRRRSHRWSGAGR